MVVGLLAALTAIFAVLVYAVRNSGVVWLVVGACGFLVLLFGTYVYSVWNAACVTDPAAQKLKILGLRTYELNTAGTVQIKTGEFEMGSTLTRRIMLINEQGELVTAFATSFLTKRGACAEPAARELAEVLGVEFVPTLEPWEYDSKAKREHDAREKAEQKAQKGQKKSRTKTVEQPVPVQEEDNINYDALDDEK